MSTLITINLHTLGNRRAAQKKSAKSQDDPEDLRKQRMSYENVLRKSRRDQKLEERRKVLEKLNWTVAWSDDEEDSDESQFSVEYLVNSIVDSEFNIGQRHATIDNNLSNLSYILDVCRKKLSKEVDSILSSTARFRKPVAGPLTSALSCPRTFGVILKLLMNCHSSPVFSSYGLTMTRELTAIIADLTRFDLVLDTLDETSSCLVLMDSLQRILEDVRMDLVCFSNSFNILNHIISSKKSQSHVNHQTLFGNVLFHLTRALNVYGPEENVTNLYIKSMTQLLTVVIPPLFKEHGFIDDQNFCTTFDQILSVLESLFRLRDIEVTLNVMKVLAIVSDTQKGILLLFQRQSLITHIIGINESFVDFTSDQIQLKVAAHSYEVIANMLAADRALCAYFVNTKFFDQAYNGIRTNDFDVDFNVSRILCLVIQSEPQAFELFFERKLTDYFTSIFFMSDNRTQAMLLDIVHQMSTIATPEQASRMLNGGFICCTENFISYSGHEFESTHKVLEIHRNLMVKSEQGGFLEETLDICASLKPHLERLLECKNQKIAEDAIYLMEVYFDPIRNGTVSPTSRVH